MPEERRPETEEEQIRCKRCGASLRGLEPDANCQACGSPVSITLFARADERKLAADNPVPDDLRCSRCGESLSGVAKIGRCPRCELAVKQSLSEGGWESAVGDDGVVQSDAACRKCGYNLRGLPASGNCPECATAVALSTRGDFLCYADPVWSRKIARGSTWMCRGMIIVVVSILGGFSCALGMGVVMGMTWGFVLVIPIAIGVLAFFAGLILICVGAWIITIPDPAQPSHASGVTARKLIRIGLFLFVVRIAVDGIAESIQAPQVVMIGVILLGIPMRVMSVIATIAYYGYLAKLTARIPNDALTRRATRLKLWMGLGLGLLSFIGILDMVQDAAMFGPPGTAPAAASGNDPFSVLGTIARCIAIVGGLILLVSVILAIILQWQVSNAAREQAKRAEWNWHCPDDSPFREAPA